MPLAASEGPNILVETRPLDKIKGSGQWPAGVARIYGESGIMGLNQEVPMARVIEVQDESEELAALQAIETVRALRQAMKQAPAGKGLATMESAVRNVGMDHLRRMFDRVVREHPEAQKKGSAL